MDEVGGITTRGGLSRRRRGVRGITASPPRTGEISVIRHYSTFPELPGELPSAIMARD